MCSLKLLVAIEIALKSRSSAITFRLGNLVSKAFVCPPKPKVASTIIGFSLASIAGESRAIQRSKATGICCASCIFSPFLVLTLFKAPSKLFQTFLNSGHRRPTDLGVTAPGKGRRYRGRRWPQFRKGLEAPPMRHQRMFFHDQLNNFPKPRYPKFLNEYLHRLLRSLFLNLHRCEDHLEL